MGLPCVLLARGTEANAILAVAKYVMHDPKHVIDQHFVIADLLPGLREHRILGVGELCIVAKALLSREYPEVALGHVLKRLDGSTLVGIRASRDHLNFQACFLDDRPLSQSFFGQGFVGLPNAWSVDIIGHGLVGVGDPFAPLWIGLNVVRGRNVRQARRLRVVLSSLLELLQRPRRGLWQALERSARLR